MRSTAALALSAALWAGSAAARNPVSAPRPAGAVTSQPAAAAPGEPHGSRIEVVGGQRVVHLFGDARARGEAQGRLLRTQILDAVEHYALAELGVSRFGMARAVIMATAKIPAALRTEAEGVIAGIQAAGGARVETLGRDLDVFDLLTINAYTDLVAIGCSSVSTWGASNDAGTPRLVRNLDWSTRPALLRNQVVLVHHPSEPDRQPLVSVAFAGYLGCLSCVNAAGVGMFFNMGYGGGAAKPLELLGGFAPANLLLRELMETGDHNADGKIDRYDVSAGLTAARHAGSYIVHAIDGTAALVVEVERRGAATRETQPGDTLPETALIATNHLRALAEPEPCGRYARAEARVRKGALDAEAQWALGRSLGLGSVVNALQYDVAPGTLRLWLRAEGAAKTEGAAVDHDLKALWAAPAKTP